jgi:hypothetical protein
VFLVSFLLPLVTFLHLSLLSLVVPFECEVE